MMISLSLGVLLLTRMQILSGSRSLKIRSLVLGRGLMESSGSDPLLVMNLEQLRPSQSQKELYSALESDALHWSGQGSSPFNPEVSISPGSDKAIPGPSHSLPKVASRLALASVLSVTASLMQLTATVYLLPVLLSPNPDGYPVRDYSGR